MDSEDDSFSAVEAGSLLGCFSMEEKAARGDIVSWCEGIKGHMSSPSEAFF